MPQFCIVFYANYTILVTQRGAMAQCPPLYTPLRIRFIGVDSTLLDPAVPEIFYFKHDVGASLIKILIGNPDVSMQ